MSMAPSGISAVGDLPWGSHFCQFYEGREDLADGLLPFFKAGLENNEKCLWVTSEPFGTEDARSALRNAVPDLARRESGGQIEIMDHHSWYLRTGGLTPDATVEEWVARAHGAVGESYTGLRLTGNTFWLQCESFDEFADYEATVNRRFIAQPIIAMCSYCLGRCRPTDILEVVRNHQFAVTRRRGAWEVIEDASLKIARSELEQLNATLESRVRERTEQLERALTEKTELFGEVHHRVRNNLQVVSSLVRMKLRQDGRPDIRETFADVLGRIDAIGLVHDVLYDSGEASRVPVSEYLDRLCGGIAQLQNDQDRVAVHVSADRAEIGLDQAVTLGLIANELVTNSLKHAFPDGRSGEVTVTFVCEANACELAVIDDGICLEKALQSPRSGLRLVKSLCAQLEATVTEELELGRTGFRIRFPRRPAQH